MASIAIQRCIGGRDLTEPRLSPDATKIVFAQSGAGGAVLIVQRLDGAPARQLTTWPAPRPGRGFGGGCWCWTPDSAAVVYAAADGNLWWQPLGAGGPRCLTACTAERAAQAPMVSPDGTRVVYVVDQAEVWTTVLDTGASERLDDASADFCFDPWVATSGSTVAWQAWNVPDMPWDRSRMQRRAFDGDVVDELLPAGSIQQLGCLPDGQSLCIRDDHGWNNLWIGNEALVDEPFEHAGPSWGLGQRSYAVSPDGDRVAFTRNEAGFGRLCVVDVHTHIVTEVAKGVHGQLSWSGTRLCALRSGARTPTQIVLYDTTSWERQVVAIGPVAGWEDEPLAEPELFEATSSVDGATVYARLYRAEPATDRLLVSVHGGPTDQWMVTFLPRVAYWRALGWNVLVPDYRGSSGHGRAYQQALRGRWGELDVADVADVVRAVHGGGLSRPARTALMGGSAGGLTVLTMLARNSDLAAAGAVSYPVTDLFDLNQRSHRFERHYNDSLIGPEPTTADADGPYRDRSPITFCRTITTPLLVLHGDADPVVPVEQSQRLSEQMSDAGAPIELHVYPGEGHGFRQPMNQIDEYRRLTEFLDVHVPPDRVGA